MKAIKRFLAHLSIFVWFRSPADDIGWLLQLNLNLITLLKEKYWMFSWVPHFAQLCTTIGIARQFSITLISVVKLTSIEFSPKFKLQEKNSKWIIRKTSKTNFEISSRFDIRLKYLLINYVQSWIFFCNDSNWLQFILIQILYHYLYWW